MTANPAMTECFRTFPLVSTSRSPMSKDPVTSRPFAWIHGSSLEVQFGLNAVASSSPGIQVGMYRVRPDFPELAMQHATAHATVQELRRLFPQHFTISSQPETIPAPGCSGFEPELKGALK